jgi:hypothetical protein
MNFKRHHTSDFLSFSFFIFYFLLIFFIYIIEILFIYFFYKDCIFPKEPIFQLLGKERCGERNSILMKWMCEQCPLHVAVHCSQMQQECILHLSCIIRCK